MQQIFPTSSLANGPYGSDYALLFNNALKTTNFNTCDRQAKLFAQIGHESAGFNAVVEGQNSNGKEIDWSISGLLNYFKRTAGAKRHWFNQNFWDEKKYKSLITVNYYETDSLGTYKPKSNKDYYGEYNGAIQPQYHVKIPTDFEQDSLGGYKKYSVPSDKKSEYTRNIFIYAYDGANGNISLSTDPNSWDGWNYRGKGAIQLTGRRNYRNNQEVIKKWFNLNFDLENNPDLVATNRIVVVYSSVAYILQNVSKIDDIDNMTIDQFSALVNTGDSKKSSFNGKEDRANRYNNLILNINLFACEKE